MKGGVIEDLLETVYVPQTVQHMLSGYARAWKGRMLASSAVIKLMIEHRSGCLTGVSLRRLQDLHQLLIQGSCHPEVVLNTQTAVQLTQILQDLTHDLASESRTGKLWVNYVMHVQIMRLFIYAERTGDWDLHLYCVAQMIPVFHASAHLAYARSSRRYLDTMRNLPNIMRPDQYEHFTKNGYFTIRKSHRFWSGNFSDQTIEQVLMRQLKVSGGLAHGRGITASRQAKFVHVMPRCVPICNKQEEFCSTHSTTSEQHYDLRAATSNRDAEHFTAMYEWLRDHSPFVYAQIDGLVNISTGIVANSSANSDEASEIGKSIADKLTGQIYGEVKLKRSERAISMSAANNEVHVLGKEVDVNSSLLFMRVTCIIEEHKEMAGHLCYEFARRPPALFDSGLMRKTAKSVLGKLLKGVTDPETEPPRNAHYFVDGGCLLQTVVWPKTGDYGGVCDEYIAYIRRHFGYKVTCLFDGYKDPNSTKRIEQERIKNERQYCPKYCVQQHKKAIKAYTEGVLE